MKKTGVALGSAIFALLAAMTGCETTPPIRTQTEISGGTFFKRFPPCNTNGQYSNCELATRHFVVGHDGIEYNFLDYRTEIGPNGTENGLTVSLENGAPEDMWCRKNGKSVVSTFSQRQSNEASSFQAVERICEPIRLAMEKEASDAIVVSAEQRLKACDSFGFERGTEAHAECAMKLYMNEQNQGTAKAVTSSLNQQTAALARQQAIQEATLKEQQRIQELEASLRMMQIGIDLMNGTTSSPTPSKTHSQTYNINGQIINCTTTGSFTNCY